MSSDSKTAFFRQSGWMVIATFLGGVFMAAVQTVAGKMPADDYSSFGALLRVLIILSIPASALQTIFAQQAAATHSEEKERELAATTRAVFVSTFVIWLIVAASVIALSGNICRALKIDDPFALYLAVFFVLVSYWTPVLKGLLQGEHKFGGLGWLSVVDGVGRFGIAAFAVLVFHGKIVSVMAAACAGQLGVLVIGGWMTRETWKKHRSAVFRWRAWLGRALPLTMGIGAVLAMSSIDTPFVQSHFIDTKQTELYVAAMMTGFAIVQFIAPVAQVMFPRLVRSVAGASGLNSLTMALGATACFGGAAAVFATAFPRLPLRLMYFPSPRLWAAAPLVPWFAWAQLPLTIANVLTQNVLARSRFAAAPWLILVPILYTGALLAQAPHLATMNVFDAFVRIVQTQGVFSALLCGVAAWFCRSPAARSGAAGRDAALAPAVSGKSGPQRP